LTVEGLIHVIQEAVTDTGMRQRAAALGAKIRAEDGVATAVNLVQQIAG
jgi:UDP:flavonoid glycosyltransferase YjiC (YdhE family)